MPKKTFKFGERVKIAYRMNDDPNKYLYFVREVDRRLSATAPGMYMECTDGNNSFGLYAPKDVQRLSKKDKAHLGIEDAQEKIAEAYEKGFEEGIESLKFVYKDKGE